MNSVTYYAFSNEFEKIARGGVLGRLAKRLGGRALPSQVAETVPYASGDELLNLMRSADDIALSGSEGIHSLGRRPNSLQRSIRKFELASKAQAVREANMASKIEEAMRSGAFDPKQHSVAEFMRSGNIVPKRQVAAPPAWRPEGTSASIPAPGMTPISAPAATAGPAPRMPTALPQGEFKMPGAMPQQTSTMIHQPTSTVVQTMPPRTQAAAGVPAAASAAPTTSPAQMPRAKKWGLGAGLLGAGGLAGYAAS